LILYDCAKLRQIADIEYLQRKLFTALKLPKSLLGFGKLLVKVGDSFARYYKNNCNRDSTSYAP
jgi:hypothetical protein